MRRKFSLEHPIMNRIRREAMKPEGVKEPILRTKREPSVNERDAEYQPLNYGFLFCPHKKSYFEPCPTCKRDAARSNNNLEMFLRKHNL